MAERAVGFIGLGIMGSLQAANLAKAGYELTVFNRTREKARGVGGRARRHASPTRRAAVAEALRRRDHDGRRRRPGRGR